MMAGSMWSVLTLITIMILTEYGGYSESSSTSTPNTHSGSTSTPNTHSGSTSTPNTHSGSTSTPSYHESSTSTPNTHSGGTSSPYPYGSNMSSPYPYGSNMSSPYPYGSNMSSPYPYGSNMSSPYPYDSSTSSPYPYDSSTSSPYPYGSNMSSPYPYGSNMSSPYPYGSNMSSPYPYGSNMSSPYPYDSSTSSPYPYDSSTSSPYPYDSSTSSPYPYGSSTSSPNPYETSTGSSSSDSYGCDSISSSPSGSIPSLCYTGISLDTLVKEDAGIPRAAAKCTFDIEPGYLYQINIGSTTELAVSSDKMDWEEVAGYSVWIQDFDISNSGFGLEQWYHCSVTVFDSYGSTLVYGPVYSPRETPVYFPNAVEVDRSGFGYFSVYINLPFTCPDGSCKLNIKFYDIDEDYACLDTQITFVGDTCGWQHDVSDVPNDQSVGLVNITLATINNNKYYPRDWFNLRMVFETEGPSEDWWNGEFSTNIQGTIKDDDTYWNYAVCSIENDPYVGTWDYFYFYLPGNGIYDAVIHTILPVRVQVMTEMCVWGGSCSCGLIVQAGRDVFMTDHCGGAHDTQFLFYEDGLLEVYTNYNSYEIYLPHGMVVRATISNPNWFWWANFTMINIQIYPTPFDMGKLDGICGNFDGDWYNDIHYAYNPSLWDVTDTAESLYRLDTSDFSDLQPYTDDDRRCICMGNNGQGDATCSVKATDTCTGTTRKRRSASRNKRWETFTLNAELADAMRADTVFSSKKRRERRSPTQQERVKRGTSALSYAEAMNECELQMAIYCGTLQNSAGVDAIVNITVRKGNCANDTMRSPEYIDGWAMVACAGLMATAEAIVDNAEDHMGTATVAAISFGCPGNCGGHGTCGNDGVCICYEGYGMIDCTSDLAIPADILGITGDGICDKATQTCSFIRIVTNGVVDGCQCRIVHTAIDIYNNHRTVDIQIVQAVFISIYEVYCEVPASKKRRRRSVSSSPLEVADGYNISISNDGNVYSGESSVVSLDTTCLTYISTDTSIIIQPGYCIIDGVCYGDGTMQAGTICTYCDVTADVFEWTLYSGQCLIDGVCYADGDTMVGDVCHFCNSSTGATVWTNDESTASCSSDDEEDEGGLAPYQIAVIVICVLAFVGGIAALVFYYMKKDMKKGSVGTANVSGLYDMQRNNKFHLRPDTAGKSIWTTPVEHQELIAKPGNVPDNLYQDCELGSALVRTVPDGNNASPGLSTPGRSFQGATTAVSSTIVTLPSEATP